MIVIVDYGMGNIGSMFAAERIDWLFF